LTTLWLRVVEVVGLAMLVAAALVVSVQVQV
jgi:hypothetical protein